MRKSKYTENDLRDALENTCGNITHAAVILGTTKTHAMRLVRKMSMRDYALKLRIDSGRAATGKPPSV